MKIQVNTNFVLLIKSSKVLWMWAQSALMVAYPWAGGFLSLMICAAAMALSDVCVVSNSLWLRWWKHPPC